MRLLGGTGMDEPQLGMRARWSSRPPASGPYDAVETTHRFLAALLERDLDALEAQLDANVCSWWTRQGRLASIEGAPAFSRALVALVDRDPPTRLDVRHASRVTAVTSSLVDDELCWSLELNVEDGIIVGAYVRGADLG
jgi:hypothetical protein